jgi:hypothetical protein
LGDDDRTTGERVDAKTGEITPAPKGGPDGSSPIANKANCAAS